MVSQVAFCLICLPTSVLVTYQIRAQASTLGACYALFLGGGTRYFGASEPHGLLCYARGPGWVRPPHPLLCVSCHQVLVTYGTRALALAPSSDPYGRKYKGIWLCLTILSRALGGNYVNFGVFELYGDPALKASTLSLFCGMLYAVRTGWCMPLIVGTWDIVICGHSTSWLFVGPTCGELTAAWSGGGALLD